MAKLSILSLGLTGHINPILPVVRELVARGEEVTFYTTENFRSGIEGVGSRFTPFRSSFQADPTKPMPVRLMEDIGPTLEQVLPAIRQEKPDKILYDAMCVAGRVVSEALRLPSVRFVQGLALKEDFHFEVTDHFQKNALLLSTQYGVSPFSLRDVFTEAAPLNIVFTSRSFQPDAESFPSSFCFCGPTTEAVSGIKEPLVYISLGTVFNNRLDFFQECLTQLQGEDYRVVMATGSRIESERLTPPENFQILEHANQLDVLSHARVFVSHGGLNSIMESLSYGVPLVLFPQTEEQRLNSKRVQELGAGEILEDPRHLKESIWRVHKNRTVKAEKISEDLKAAGGFRLAADAIQEKEI